MRVFVETNAINWLADSPEDAERFFALVKEGRFAPIVAVEVANEVRRTPEPERLRRLEAVLGRFFPLAPTYLPRLGYRLGTGMMTDSGPEETLASLGFLKHRMDRTHLVNARGHRCEIFLTRDAEMLKKKVHDIDTLLGVTHVEHPATFLAELLAEANGGR